MSDNPYITRMSMTICQEGNTLGTTEEFEEITVDLEYQLPHEEPFIVIKTAGWSIDGPEDLASLIQKVKDSETLLRKSLILLPG